MSEVRTLIVAVALCAAGVAAYQARSRAIEARSGTFFRLKVALTYKQQPVGFDIVVGCGVHIGHPAVGGTSNEVMAMTALVYAKAIPEGHAISVRSVSVGDLGSPCQGATSANGEIPPNWLPTIIWYDRAEDLSHGLAYVTQDAFSHPKAQLSFGGATVEATTRADYDAFVASGARNLVPSRIADWMIKPDATFYKRDQRMEPELVADPWKAWTRTGHLTCRAMRRWKLPAAFVQRVRAAWPSHRPRIWVPAEPLASDLLSWISNHGRSRLFRYSSDPSKPTPDDGEEVFASHRDDGLSNLSPTTFQDGTYYDDTTLDGPNAERGFAFCDRQVAVPLYKAVTARSELPSNNTSVTCRIGGQVTVKGNLCDGGLYVALEDDTYLFRPMSSFGD